MFAAWLASVILYTIRMVISGTIMSSYLFNSDEFLLRGMCFKISKAPIVNI